MKKVITLTPEEFEASCRELEKKVRDSGFDFEILIGIATGGTYVADHMHAPLRLDIIKQRPATSARHRLLPGLLKRLPRKICDFMRIAESRFYALVSLIKPAHATPTKLPDSLMDTLRTAGTCTSVLIVDDAVDSGTTMLSVVQAVSKAAPDAEVRTAALTLTRPAGRFTPAPLITPDYLLFPAGAIIRFPWAPDAPKLAQTAE